MPFRRPVSLLELENLLQDSRRINHNLHFQLTNHVPLISDMDPSPHAHPLIEAYMSILFTGRYDNMLSLINQGGPQPTYTPSQREGRAMLANVKDRLVVMVGAAGTGKTWYHIALMSEFLHGNGFQVTVVSHCNDVIQDVALRYYLTFQNHPSLRDKIVCLFHAQPGKALLLDMNGRPGRLPLLEDVTDDTLVSQCIELGTALRLKARLEKTKHEDGINTPSWTLQTLSFGVRMVEWMERSAEKYRALKEFCVRCKQNVTVDDGDEKKNLAKMVMELKAETLQCVDIAVLPCDMACQDFYESHCLPDILVLETSGLGPVREDQALSLMLSFKPQLTVLISNERL